MSAAPGIALSWFLCGLGAAVLLMRLQARLRQTAAPAVDARLLPAALRLLILPARAFRGPVGDLLPEGYRTAIRRRLERADLYPEVDAALWTSACLCAAVTASSLACAATLLTRTDTLLVSCLVAPFTWLGCQRWLRRRISDCEQRIVRELPPCLDLLTVCVEAGATLTAAARLIVDQAPPGPLRNYFDRVLREVRSGRLRAQAFVGVADAYGVECLSTMASALAHAEAAGMSVSQVLRTQAEQRSAERFVRAERQAMQAPVKMLGPLIFCIFPCTFIVLAVPIAHRLMEAFGT